MSNSLVHVTFTDCIILSLLVIVCSNNNILFFPALGSSSEVLELDEKNGNGIQLIQLHWKNSGRCWLITISCHPLMLQGHDIISFSQNASIIYDWVRHFHHWNPLEWSQGVFPRSSFDVGFNMCLMITTYSCTMSASQPEVNFLIQKKTLEVGTLKT